MTDTQARARVWTRCLAALVLAALTGPVVGLLTPLAHASSPRWPMPPRPPFTSWPPSSPRPLSAPMWPSPSCSSSPSCASCGLVPTAAPSPPGRAAHTLVGGA